MKKLWDTLVRWRTWLVNALFAVLLTPELLVALLGFDWKLIVPPGFMPYVTLAIIILNVWMRPRPAATRDDPEVQVREAIKASDGPVKVEVTEAGGAKAVIRA